MRLIAFDNQAVGPSVRAEGDPRDLLVLHLDLFAFGIDHIFLDPHRQQRTQRPHDRFGPDVFEFDDADNAVGVLGIKRSHHPGQTANLGGGFDDHQSVLLGQCGDRPVSRHQTSKLFHQRVGRCNPKRQHQGHHFIVGDGVWQRAHEGGHITLGHLSQGLEVQHVLPAAQHDPLGLQNGVEHLQAIVDAIRAVTLVTERARGRRGFPHHRQTRSAPKEIHDLLESGFLEGKGDGGLG